MKSVIALTVGLMIAGVAAAYSEFSLVASTATQPYLFSIPEPNPFLMLLASVVVILFVGFREHQALIDRKAVAAEDPVQSRPAASTSD
jgi:hypothetical protein